MTYHADVDWAPAHELIASYGALALTSGHKVLDVGPGWIDSVKKRFTQKELKRLALRGNRFSFSVLHLVGECPGERSATAFIEWLAQVPLSEFQRLTNCFDQDRTSDRDQLVDALRLWHERYFAQIDPAILEYLASKAQAVRREHLSPPELVEKTTRGIVLSDPAVQRITLIPQYHMSPLTMLEGNLPERRYFLFPVEFGEEDPPIMLTRLTRALGDPSRLRILKFLRQGQASFTDVVQVTGLAKSTVHHHLTALRTAGLLQLHLTSASQSRYALRPDAHRIVSRHLAQYLDLEE